MKLLQRMAALESRLTNIPLNLGESNFTLTFKINNGAITIDPETGVEAATVSDIILSAYLSQDNNQSKDNIEVPGYNNPSSIKMSGYLIYPTTLPLSVRPMSEATILSNSEDYPMKGKFLLLPSFANSATIQGHTIRGIINLNPGAA